MKKRMKDHELLRFTTAAASNLAAMQLTGVNNVYTIGAAQRKLRYLLRKVRKRQLEYLLK